MSDDPRDLDVTCPDGHRMMLRASRYGPFWGCIEFPLCRHTHGAHPDGRPLGTPAGPVVKAARVSAHAALDRLWKGRDAPMNRDAVYAWLRHTLSIPAVRCHIGLFDLPLCRRVVQLCQIKTESERIGADARRRQRAP